MTADSLVLTVRLLPKGIDCVNDEFEIMLVLTDGDMKVKLCVVYEPFAVAGNVVLKLAVLEVTVGWKMEDLDSEPGIVEDILAGMELLLDSEELRDAGPLGELIYDE